MRVAKKADGGVLIREARGGRQFVEHITPPLRTVEGRVDDGEAVDHPHIFQIFQIEKVKLA